MDKYFTSEDIERIDTDEAFKESLREYTGNPLFSTEEAIGLWKVLWANKQQGSKIAPTMEPTDYSEFLFILVILAGNQEKEDRVSWSTLKSLVPDNPLFAKESQESSSERGVPIVIVYPIDEHCFAGMSMVRNHRAAEVACSIERTLIERYYKLGVNGRGKLDYISRGVEIDEVTKKIVTNLKRLGLLWEEF